MISVSTSAEHTVSTVSSVRHEESGSGPKRPQTADDVRDNKHRPIWWARARSGRPPSRPQTMLTVLTVTPSRVLA